MSDVMDEYPHLNDLSIPQLHQRYQQLKPNAGEVPSDDTLRELIVLARILRKRSSAPTTKVAKSKAAPTLDAL